MTALMEQAFEKLRNLSSERQDELAPMVMMLAENEERFELTPEDEAAIAISRAQALRGEFATDEHMRAIRAKYKL